MTTVLDIVTGAARLLGVVRKGEALDADEASDALSSLNDMLGSWSTSSLNITSRVVESFTLPAPASSYSIGPGQTLNTSRPVDIIAASMRFGDVDYPLTIVSDEEFELIALKSIQSTPSSFLNYDNGYPYGTIRLYSVPYSGSVLRLISEKEISSFADLNDAVDMAPGTRKALRYNLAVEMAPEYGVEPSQIVINEAAKSLGAIRRAVARNRRIPYMPNRIQGPNIFTGYNWR